MILMFIYKSHKTSLECISNLQGPRSYYALLCIMYDRAVDLVDFANE